MAPGAWLKAMMVVFEIDRGVKMRVWTGDDREALALDTRVFLAVRLVTINLCSDSVFR